MILHLIVDSCEEHEVVTEWKKQLTHRDHRGSGGNKIVKDDDVALFGRFSAKGKNRADTMLRVALGDIFVEGYAEQIA